MQAVLRMIIACVVLWAAGAGALAQEYDTDRPGRDYRDFDLRAPDFNLCRRECENDQSCRAWTFAHAKEGQKAHCWLKSAVPEAKSDDCCVSGVKPVSDDDRAERCRDYATRSVSQNEENERRRCGFSGSRWQSNRKAHFEGCLSVTAADARAILALRDKQLAACAVDTGGGGGGDGEENVCRDYAEAATTAAKEASRLNCNFSGDRWTTVYTRHYNWCRLASRAERESEGVRRSRDLKTCRDDQGNTEREDACRTYSEEAVQQQGENRNLNCGLTGPRWQSRTEPHFRFCMTASAEARAEESGARRRALRRCRENTGDGGSSDRSEACREYADAAAGQQAENRRLGCGYSGEAWQSSPAGHYQWCMNARRSERDALMDKRKADLARCKADDGGNGDEDGGSECEDYARQSVRDARESRRLECGFDGPGWRTDIDRHIAFCEQAPPRARAKELKRRADLLGICVAAPTKSRRCREYGNGAIGQQRENLSLGCGFTGPRWHTSYEDHYLFCMQSPRLVRGVEQFARETALASCR